MLSNLLRATALIIAIAAVLIVGLAHGHASSIADGFGWGVVGTPAGS